MVAFLPLTTSAPGAESTRPAVKMELVVIAEGKVRNKWQLCFLGPQQWEQNDEICQLVFTWSFLFAKLDQTAMQHVFD